jgi:MoxR-like ATPase
MTDPAELYEDVRAEVGNVLVGNEAIVEGLTVALLTRGHVLLEGVPGVAKTTVANVFARATGLDYTRVQMTPDILPADVTGTEVYRQESGEFELQKGPVFANLVVADEINRATPKTQSALLEAMQERQVSLGGESLALPEPFMVVATQNPIEMEGTYELPEAQKDRFMLKYTMELLDFDDEKAVLDRFDDAPELSPADVEQVVSAAEILEARDAVQDVHVTDEVKEFLLGLVQATRESPSIAHGASTRASLALMNASKAQAAIRGRDFVTPDDVLDLAGPALQHRLLLTTDADVNGTTVADALDQAVSSVPTPEVDPASPPVDD